MKGLFVGKILVLEHGAAYIAMEPGEGIEGLPCIVSELNMDKDTFTVINAISGTIIRLPNAAYVPSSKGKKGGVSK